MTEQQLTEVYNNYWLIISKSQPLVKDSQVPVYWNKKRAQKDADKFGGKVVRVKCTWQIIDQNK